MTEIVKKESRKKQSLEDLKDVTTASNDEAVNSAESDSSSKKERVKTLDKFGRSYATGRRKRAVARVWLKPGKGTVTVNGEDQTTYFARKTQQLILNQPFLVANRVGQFDVLCTVTGGGLSGQAGAVRHGISKALECYEPELHETLKRAGMLTRDDRKVERKKIGKHKARRSKQWAKR